MKHLILIKAAAAALVLTVAAAQADPARDAIIATYGKAAAQPLSAARGEAFFMGTHAGGKPDTPSCTSCHSKNLKAAGVTRAGKPIEPMAVSANPKRYTDLAFVEKWLTRNCNSVLGRECDAQEKGDLLTWLSSL